MLNNKKIKWGTLFSRPNVGGNSREKNSNKYNSFILRFIAPIICSTLCILFLGGIFIPSLISWRQEQESSSRMAEQNYDVRRTTQFNNLKKIGIAQMNGFESAPFIWKGQLLYVVFNRPLIMPLTGSVSNSFSIYTYASNELVASYQDQQKLSLGLGTVLVENDTLYIFTTAHYGLMDKSAVYVVTTSDLIHFSNPKRLFSSPGEVLYNLSVTKNKAREYTMAVEVAGNGWTPFSIVFWRSSNLSHWERIKKTVFSPTQYAACPKLVYVKNQFYMFYLAIIPNDIECKKCVKYVTDVARSIDLKHWEISNYAVLVPTNDEGINNSDMDFVEYQNVVNILYLDGNQATWGNLRKATFEGTLESLTTELFPNNTQ